MEGGANVLSEAIAASIPILASRIPGNVGILGEDHPGYFETGDTKELATMMARAESDPAFLESLEHASERLTQLVEPAREKRAWRELLLELGIS